MNRATFGTNVALFVIGITKKKRIMLKEIVLFLAIFLSLVLVLGMVKSLVTKKPNASFILVLLVSLLWTWFFHLMY